MKRIILALVFFSFYNCIYAQSSSEQVLHIKSLPKSNIILDGKISEKEWEGITPITLHSPWVKRTDRIAGYRSFTDAQYLYFAFEVIDSTITLYVTPREIDVARGDRVELFFSNTRDLKNYYCLEMSPADKVLAYKAKHYRIFDHSWDLPGLQLSAQITNKGYAVEGRIPLPDLRQMAGRQRNDTTPFQLYAGVFCGDYFGPHQNDVEWHSWITPTTATPDFHTPSAFGIFEFE
jgi:hypothetical protein